MQGWRFPSPCVEHVRDVEAVLFAYFADTGHGFHKARTGHDAVQDVVTRCETAQCADGAFAALPKQCPFVSVLRRPDLTCAFGDAGFVRNADLVIDELTASVKFDEQDGAGVYWVATLKARLGGLECGPVHHFERRRGRGPRQLLRRRSGWPALRSQRWRAT